MPFRIPEKPRRRQTLDEILNRQLFPNLPPSPTRQLAALPPTPQRQGFNMPMGFPQGSPGGLGGASPIPTRSPLPTQGPNFQLGSMPFTNQNQAQPTGIFPAPGPQATATQTPTAQAPTPTSQARQGMGDYWNTPVIGDMPLSQFVQLAGGLAGAIAPGTPQGRMGDVVAGMGQRGQAEQLERDIRLPRLVNLGRRGLLNPVTGQIIGGTSTEINPNIKGIHPGPGPMTGKVVYWDNNGNPSDVEVPPDKVPSHIVPVQGADGKWYYQDVSKAQTPQIAPTPSTEIQQQKQGELSPSQQVEVFNKLVDNGRQIALNMQGGMITDQFQFSVDVANATNTQIQQMIKAGVLPKDYPLVPVPQKPVEQEGAKWFGPGGTFGPGGSAERGIDKVTGMITSQPTSPDQGLTGMNQQGQPSGMPQSGTGQQINVTEGDIARNPATGQRVQWQNGQWIPLKD